MKRGDSKAIKVAGEVLQAEYLGKGHYSTAYRVGDWVYLYTVGDHMKEMLLHCQDTAHVPVLEYIEDQINRAGDDVLVYRMRYYRGITTADKEAWAIMRELQRAMTEATSNLRDYKGARAFLAGFGYAANNALIDSAAVPESVKEALEHMASWMSSYGAGVTFEFAPRNIGVDEHGAIIFRDICFDAEKIARERQAACQRAMKRAYGY